jgi:hypothetical protein
MKQYVSRHPTDVSLFSPIAVVFEGASLPVLDPAAS